MYIAQNGINDYLICHCLDISGTLSVGTQCIISDADDAILMTILVKLYGLLGNYWVYIILITIICDLKNPTK